MINGLKKYKVEYYKEIWGKKLLVFMPWCVQPTNKTGTRSSVDVVKVDYGIIDCMYFDCQIGIVDTISQACYYVSFRVFHLKMKTSLECNVDVVINIPITRRSS